MYYTGQIRIERDWLVTYVPPPSHEEEYGHSGHDHDASYCMTATLCAADLALHHQERVGSIVNGSELRAVSAVG